MTSLSPKLERRLAAIRAAGGLVPWMDAPKQHQRLLQLGLIVEGAIEGRKFAVLEEIIQGEEHGA